MANPPRLHAYLSYRDAKAAIGWLGEAFGFEVVTEAEGEGGSVAHAELRLGEVVIMLASDDQGYDVPELKGQSVGGGLYIAVDEAEPVFERAVAAGAHIVFPLESTEWGTQRFRVLDPEGHEWSFGSYVPGSSW